MIKCNKYFSFVLFNICICICINLTTCARNGRLSRRYGESNLSSMPTYPLSYSVIQGVFDVDGKYHQLKGFRSWIVTSYYSTIELKTKIS